MYRDHKVVAVIPAGRERVLKILFKHLRANMDIVDHVQVWLNTENAEDLKYIESQADNFIRPVKLPSQYKFISKPVQHNTGRYYLYTTDEDTIYIRFDDDIVYIHDDFFPNILDKIIDHPEYFLVFANIWNNAVTSYLHQKAGNIDDRHGVVEEPYCMDEVGWRSPKFAEYIHNVLLDKIKNGKVEDLYIDDFELQNARRFSISCFAYRGKDFAKFHGNLQSKIYPGNPDSLDEEIWLTEQYVKDEGLLNVIAGNAIVSHLTFFAQKAHILNNTDIQNQYYQIAKEYESKNYYKGLKRQQEELGEA